VATAAAARGNTLQRLGTTGKTPAKVSANQNSAGTPTRDSASIGNTSSGNRTMNASIVSAPAHGSVGNVNSGTGSISIGNAKSGSNARPALFLPTTSLSAQNMYPLRTPPSLKSKRAPRGALANILSLSNSNSENWSNARSYNRFNSNITLEDLIKDDTAFAEAIADLIAYEPDTDGWADVKFLVQVNSETEIEERPFHLIGGVRETPEEYGRRLSNKRKDYVNETYQRALDLLKGYRINRDNFELSKTTTQCKIAGIDRKITEIPCWMCGYGTNLFKNATHQYREGDVILSMCDPNKNQFECEHILPAALMALLEYLANTTYPVTDNDMMKSLYAGSCAMCNKIKSDNLYIKNTMDNGNGDFVPDNDELMKDVVAFFSAIHGTKKIDPCIDGEDPVKKQDEPYFYKSIVTVNKDGLIKRRYPNLIWAMLHKDLAPPMPSSSPKRRKTDDSIESITDYGNLDSVFNSLSNSGEPFNLIVDRDLHKIPDTIQKRINVDVSVEWIKARFNIMREKIQGICSLLNARKAYWHEKYKKVIEVIPNFIKRIVYEAQEDIPVIERIIEDNTRQFQANTRNERAKRRKEMAEELLAKDRTVAISIPDDPEARIRARTYAPQRIDDELNTFEEMRARNQRGYQAAFLRGRRLDIGPSSAPHVPTPSIGPSSAPPVPTPSAPRTWGNFLRQTFGKKPKSSRKTHKTRKASKKTRRRK
jgi:hypothetical protein